MSFGLGYKAGGSGGSGGLIPLIQWGAATATLGTSYLYAGVDATGNSQAAPDFSRFLVKRAGVLSSVVFQHNRISGSPLSSLIHTLLLNGVPTIFTQTIPSNDLTIYTVSGSVNLVVDDVLTFETVCPVNSHLCYPLITAWM